jgi:O-antigen ligase
MKEVALTSDGVVLNPVASSAVFAYILGVCLIRPTRLIVALGLGVFASSALLSGSRAPVGIGVLCVAALIMIHVLRSKTLAVRVAGCAAAAVAVVLIAGAFYLNQIEIGSFTEGRSDLWKIAYAKFSERPLTGFGFESWRDDLLERLPGDELTLQTASQLEGGYHSEYLTLLAEQGLFVFLLGVAIMWALLRSCWHLAFHDPMRSRNAQFLLIAGLYLAVRAFVEAPGLFGYSQEPSDYLAYCLLAIVISRLSGGEELTRTAVVTWNEATVASGKPEWGIA